MTTFYLGLFYFLLTIPILSFILVIVAIVNDIKIHRQTKKMQHKKDMELLYENCMKRLERMKELDMIELDMKEYIDVS